MKREYDIQDESHAKGIQNLAIRNTKVAVSYFMAEKLFKEAAVEETGKVLLKEAEIHCSTKNPSILHSVDKTSPEDLTMEKVAAEMQVGTVYHMH